MSNTHTVRQGENLWKIAKENNISHQDLVRANPQLDDVNLIQPGARLQLPRDHFEPATSANSALLHSPNTPATGLSPAAPDNLAAPMHHNVRRGESLWEIAKNHRVSFSDVLSANTHLANPNSIQPGQKISIPVPRLPATHTASGSVPSRPTVTWHQVMAGHEILSPAKRGPAVSSLQNRLRKAGYPLAIDGIFGAQTQSAVRSFQQENRLEVDGLVGPKTALALGAGNSVESHSVSGARTPTPTGASLERFPIGSNRFNVGYDSSWNNFDASTAQHNSDYSLRATNASHPTGHLGVDIFGPRGAPIVSPVTGVVASINRNASVGGNTVTIRRGNYFFYHAHLDSIETGLQVGSAVSAGKMLGTLGNSGSARGTEPHLHFSMYRGANGYRSGTINPFSYLQGALQSSAIS